MTIQVLRPDTSIYDRMISDIAKCESEGHDLFAWTWKEPPKCRRCGWVAPLEQREGVTWLAGIKA